MDSQLRKDISNLIKTNVDNEGERSRAVDFLEKQEMEINRLARRIKKLKYDYSTIMEIINQISAKSLDLERMDGYTISTVRGQFGISKVFIIRQKDFESKVIYSIPSKNIRVPNIQFDMVSSFGKLLVDKGYPFSIEDEELNEYKEVRILRESNICLLVPLVKTEKSESPELKGVLCLGKKISEEDFSDDDLEFISLIGNMVAICIHNAQLYHRSIVDSLTQVYTRAHFDMHLSEEIARSERYGPQSSEFSNKYVSLIMMDLDDFKQVNDTYGHQFGDKVLKAIGEVLSGGTRKSDIVARYGGEEFTLIFPETSKKRAKKLAERLRKKVEETIVSSKDAGKINITVSLGVATFPDDAKDMRELIAKADMALYEAKRSGKNIVCQA